MNFPLPKQLTAHVSSKKGLNLKTTELVLNVDQPFDFYAGQFINLKVSDKKYRSYSIASNPARSEQITLIVSTGHKGLGSDYVNTLKDGDQVDFIGPSGRFVLPEDLGLELEFYATGTGLAPFIAMFDQLYNTGYKGHINLYFGIRNASELYYRDLLNSYVSKLNFSYKIYYSELEGRITKRLEEVLPTTAQYFLCGNPSMIDEMLQALPKKGVQEHQIFHEKFTNSNN